jgi:hypothetical protein
MPNSSTKRIFSGLFFLFPLILIRGTIGGWGKKQDLTLLRPSSHHFAVRFAAKAKLQYLKSIGPNRTRKKARIWAYLSFLTPTRNSPDRTGLRAMPEGFIITAAGYGSVKSSTSAELPFLLAQATRQGQKRHQTPPTTQSRARSRRTWRVEHGDSTVSALSESLVSVNLCRC